MSPSKSKAAGTLAIVVTRADFAKLIACAPDRVTKLCSEGMPGIVAIGSGRGHRTKIDLSLALPWFLQRRASGLDDERRRWYQLQANRVAQDIRQRDGELVDVAAIDRRWAGLVTAARERLLSLPRTALQRGLIGSVAEDGLIELVDDALNELAQKGI